jgi:hypothetical protein
MADQQEVGAIFPVAGLDVTCEFDRQPPDTTPGAGNVRSYDSLLSRKRGGSRAGLSRFVNETVNGVAEIQHLALLVDPQNPALNAPVDEGTVPDPSTNNLSQRNFGRNVRDGGSGLVPNRNDPRQTSEIKFVQQARTQGVVNDSVTVNLPNLPTVGNHIFVVVRTQASGASPELPSSVRNGGLVDYAEAGTLGSPEAVVTDNVGGPEETQALTVWWKKVADAADQSVVVTAGGEGSIYEIILLEYSGANPAAPVSNAVEGADASAASTFTLPDLALNNTSGQLVLAAYVKVNTGPAALPSGFTARFGAANLVLSSEPANTLVLEAGNLSGVGPSRPNVPLLIARPFCGIAVALKK